MIKNESTIETKKIVNLKIKFIDKSSLEGELGYSKYVLVGKQLSNIDIKRMSFFRISARREKKQA